MGLTTPVVWWHLYCPMSLIAAISHSSSASVMFECWQNYQSEGLPDPGISERPFVKFSHRRFFAFSHHTSLSIQNTNIPIYNLQSETKSPTRSQNYGSWSHRHSSHVVVTPINRLFGVDGSWLRQKLGISFREELNSKSLSREGEGKLEREDMPLFLYFPSLYFFSCITCWLWRKDFASSSGLLFATMADVILMFSDACFWELRC